MNRLGFARNIAPSLTSGPWSQTFIETTLIRRLPASLHKHAPSIATQLLFHKTGQYAPSTKAVARSLLLCDGFERAYLYCQKNNIWPSPDLTHPQMAPVAAFAGLDLPQLSTVKDLADWLFLPINRLEYLADLHDRFEDHGETAINHYHYVFQKKKSGQQRVIEAPKQNLKSLQRQILTGILDKIPHHDAAFGFVKGRNCVQAAAKHVHQEVVVCFDLKEFFPTISAGRAFGLFRCLGYPHAVARCLTGLCTTSTPARILARLGSDEKRTYRSPHLPQGSPASPALANHICFALDRRLSAMAHSLDMNFHRYADDLSFSGSRQNAAALLRAVPDVVDDAGFTLNHAKTRAMRNGSRQVVTGVVVNDHLNIDRQTYDRLKAIIHACRKPDGHRLNDHRFRAELLGKIDWVETVNPARGAKLMQLLEQAG